MPTVREQQINVQRGDDWGPYSVTLTPSSGSLAGCVVMFMVKADHEDSDDSALISLRSDDVDSQIEITDATTATVELTAAQTALLVDSWYYYDVSVVTQTGKNVTGVKGRLVMGWQVNRQTA